MYEMTLAGLVRLVESDYGKNDGKYLVIEVEIEGSEPEVIVNPKSNFESKIAYYKKAYNEDLTLKANPKVRIVRYDVVETMKHYFADRD